MMWARPLGCPHFVVPDTQINFIKLKTKIDILKGWNRVHQTFYRVFLPPQSKMRPKNANTPERDSILT